MIDYLINYIFYHIIFIIILLYNITIILNYYYSFYKIYKQLLLFKIRAFNYKLYLLDRYDIIKNDKYLNDYMMKYNNDIIDNWINKFNMKI